MRKEQISESQIYILIITFMIGTTTAISPFSQSRQNTWISLLVALAVTTPIIIIYGSIANRHPNKDIFQILEYAFGKIIGKIIGVFYTFYFFHLGAICIRNMTEFIHIASFPETPQYFTVLFIGILAIYILKAGLEVMVRVNKFIFPFLIFVIGLTIVFVFPRAHISHFLPILEEGWKPVLRTGHLISTFPFGETIAFLSFFNATREKKKASKIYLKGIYLGALILFGIIVRNILVLGPANLATEILPSFEAVSLINIGNFIRGTEIIIAIVITIAGFIKVSVCLLASCIGITRLFGFADYKWVAAPLGLLMMSLSFILYNNAMRMVEWVNIYKFYVIPFQLIIPIFVLIFGGLRRRTAN
ncbi:MAG TPA: endospore germination permease [Clostridia bacterium]|nr:endospore germination permease [Clostridia bacterium]